MRGLALVAGFAAWGCSNAKDSGPVLRPGLWHVVIVDDQRYGIASTGFTADAKGKLELEIQGRLSDGTPFTINGTPSLLYEGANFTITGTAGGRALSGFGRARVFDTLLRVLVPFDNFPDHALLVGAIPWNFDIEATATASHVEGSWGASSPVAGALNGTFVADPGPLPAFDAAIDAPPDGPADAAAD